jgi:D-alanine-D-alanine ligase
VLFKALFSMSQSSHALPIRDSVRLEDAEAVRQITSATGFFYPQEIAIAVELVEEYLAQGPASGYQFLFIDQGNQPVAYLCFGPIPCTTGSFDIYWVATHPQQQGQGLGSQLLTAAEQRILAQGGRQIFIETSSRPRYEPTRNFYARRGYEVVATLNDFYDLDDDKVVFRKRLSEPLAAKGIRPL